MTQALTSTESQLAKDLLQEKQDEALAALRNKDMALQVAQRIAFEVDNKLVGSLDATDAQLLAQAIPSLMLDQECLSVSPQCSTDSQPVFEQIADCLRQAGRAKKWRNELLAVEADDGTAVGFVERAVMRRLGIGTHAVHLIGLRRDGQMWLQRRALTKDTEPGMLDTLAGGLVGTEIDCGQRRREAFSLAVRREAWEEAGLPMNLPVNLKALSTQRVRHLYQDGYMVEDLHAYASVLPDDFRPFNQDGEVDEFLCLSPAAVLHIVQEKKMSLVASLVTLGFFCSA